MKAWKGTINLSQRYKKDSRNKVTNGDMGISEKELERLWVKAKVET